MKLSIRSSFVVPFGFSAPFFFYCFNWTLIEFALKHTSNALVYLGFTAAWALMFFVAVWGLRHFADDTQALLSQKQLPKHADNTPQPA